MIAFFFLRANYADCPRQIVLVIELGLGSLPPRPPVSSPPAAQVFHELGSKRSNPKIFSLFCPTYCVTCISSCPQILLLLSPRTAPRAHPLIVERGTQEHNNRSLQSLTGGARNTEQSRSECRVAILQIENL